ncbi:hypothetical protein VFPPC_15265 [Pochonia chlamydosporia 170]|uniref:Uncharacterized protein n=1 Tax=Pochonia chlamydosporia 170 TaxID=1380566 RepID=A0A179G5U4_METCM|nr:hypothetical protein VFPPC_15265 [Pochonia chlamydosporia 170]OAQ73192.1 hypothetical protein VFPPC_15265 [Pochonia chlamydosporia 170]
MSYMHSVRHGVNIELKSSVRRVWSFLFPVLRTPEQDQRAHHYLHRINTTVGPTIHGGRSRLASIGLENLFCVIMRGLGPHDHSSTVCSPDFALIHPGPTAAFLSLVQVCTRSEAPDGRDRAGYLGRLASSSRRASQIVIFGPGDV